MASKGYDENSDLRILKTSGLSTSVTNEDIVRSMGNLGNHLGLIFQ